MHAVLGLTTAGRDTALLQACIAGAVTIESRHVCHAGTPGEGKRAVWVIARQHPGESMAEWFMQVPRQAAVA
jgi:hypothetical protein